MTVHVQPDTVDTTGTIDAGLTLNTWLRALPLAAGDRITFDGTLRVDESLTFGDPHHPIDGVTFDLTTAHVQMPSPVASHYGQPVVRCSNLHDTTVLLGQITGANQAVHDAVQAGKEAYAGISIGGGSTDTVIEGGLIDHVWGDFIFVGAGHNKNLTVRGVHGRAAGRHAISARDCDGLTIDAVDMRNHRHLFFDHEPAKGEGLTNLDIGNSTSSEGAHGFLQLFPLPGTRMGQIRVHDHTLIGGGHYRITAHTGGVQRQGFALERLANDAVAAGRVPLVVVGDASAGWDGVLISELHDVVRFPERAVKLSPLCSGVNVDLSGIVAYPAGS